MLVRFRRSRGAERQQLRWFAVIAAFVLTGFAPLYALGLPTGEWAVAVVIGAIPVTTGVAILRHRLYDIDRLVSRTVSYALLTAVLGAVHAGGVVLGGQVVGIGGSEPAVAASTLLAAALFGPLRRIQLVVDRRFNRLHYDARQVVEAFRGGLRSDPDLDALTASLLTAVQRTLEPAELSLWLRSPPAGRSAPAVRGPCPVGRAQFLEDLAEERDLVGLR
jgi:hypothetical protein